MPWGVNAIENVLIKEILIPIVAGVGYVLKILVDKYIKNRKPFSKRVLTTLTELSDLLNDMVAETDCTRAIILKCQNGGGIPKVGSELYSSVVLESRASGGSVRHVWDKQRLDAVYIRVLVDLDNADDGMMLVEQEDFKGSVLYDVYTTTQIKGSKIARLAETKTAWFYVSANFSKPIDQLETREKVLIQSSINKMRYLLKKNKDIL